MKVGDLVKCRYTNKIGIIVSVPQAHNWNFSVLFPEGIEQQNGGYLEVVSERRCLGEIEKRRQDRPAHMYPLSRCCGWKREV